jgi:Fe2+ transport system protein FeoA
MCHLGPTAAAADRAYLWAMPKPDLPTRIWRRAGGGPNSRLAWVLPGVTVRVTGLPEWARQALQQEGVVIGADLTVERRVGMGGPLIVRLGRARLAISRRTARGIEVEPVEKRP